MTTSDERNVLDRTREPWTVEEASRAGDGTTVLRYRHELGYELAAVARKPLVELEDRELERLLEEVRHRRPRSLKDVA